MSRTRVSKSAFKANALALFRQIEVTGESVIITARGKPALEVRRVHHATQNPLDILRGTLVRYDNPTDPVDDSSWDAMPVIVLDTHTLVWWVTGNKDLSLRAKAAVDSEQSIGGTIVVSSISAWEIALLVARGKLIFSMDTSAWLRTVAQIEAVRFMSLDTEIAIHSVALPGQFHKDPADRMIVATARILSAPLVTKDAKIRAYPHVKTIW